MLRDVLAGKDFGDRPDSERPLWDAILADIKALPDDAIIEVPAEIEV